MSQGGTTSGNFVYLYDGTKLRAVNGAGDGFDYLGSLVYNKNGANSTLESAAFGAGRIVKTSTGYDVRYFLTDHLGSVRASVNQAGQVSDRSDYQLLGERWSGQGIEATTNRYQFNGKESQQSLGLNLLDCGARNYDPNIGRWFTPDPLAEKFSDLSSYVYCANNAINAIDPDGRKYRLVRNEKTKIITAQATYYVDGNVNTRKDAQRAVDFWNQKTATYTTKDGVKYAVKFDLDVRMSYNNLKDAEKDVAGNSFTVSTSKLTHDNAAGQTTDGQHINIGILYTKGLAPMHEIGHTLGMAMPPDKHAEEGVMTSSLDNSKLSEKVPQININQMIENEKDKKEPNALEKLIKSLRNIF